MKSDPSESDNLALQNPALVARMQTALLAWGTSLPPGPRDGDAGSKAYPWPGTRRAPAIATAADE